MTGCTPVSEACEHCYAERIARRFHTACNFCDEEPPSDSCRPCRWYFSPTFHPERLDIPLHWRKPRTVFVCSMSDIAHKAWTNEQFWSVWEVMERCPQHTFIVLTKRAKELHDRLRANEDTDGHWPLPNVWAGVTVENADHYDRIEWLRRTPAAVRLVSYEPGLGAVDFGPWLSGLEANCGRIDDGSDGPCVLKAGHCGPCCGPDDVASDWSPAHTVPKLDWVIVGGETGPGARPMQPEWALDVYRQCQDAGVPFFWKKWGSARSTKAPLMDGHMEHDCREMVRTREFPTVAL